MQGTQLKFSRLHLGRRGKHGQLGPPKCSRSCPLQGQLRHRHREALRPPSLARVGIIKAGDNPVTDHLNISGEKGRFAFEKMDKLCSEQREEALSQEADVEITIF